MQKLVIIDGNAIVHRAYHALPPMTTKSGDVVNAVYGFTSMLLKVIHDLKPTHFAVTFDVAGGSHARLKKYKEYKATRVAADQALYDQIPLCHEIVSAFNIPIYEKTGYEADDVIGTIVDHNKKLFKTGELEIYIVTGDMDTLQLVEPGVKVYALKKGISDIVIYDEAAVKARYGFGPELMVDYKALRGDPSDNIPGVPGIGEKGATDLITKLGSIKEIYKQLEKKPEQVAKQFSPGIIKKLLAGKDKAEMSFELAKLDSAVPALNYKLSDSELIPFDREKIAELFQKFEFVSLLKRLPGEPGGEASPKTKIKKFPKKLGFNFQELKTESEIKKLVAQILDSKQFACRAAVSGSDIFESKFLGLVFVVEGEGFFVNVDTVGAQYIVPLQREIFSNPDITLVGHDLKQLIKILARHCEEQSDEAISSEPGIATTRSAGLAMTVNNKLFDTMIGAYLLQPGSRAHDAAAVILKTLGKELAVSSSQASLFGFDARAAAEELFYLFEAAKILKQELTSANNLGLFESVEMPLITVLAEMELNGISVDQTKLGVLSKEVAESIKNITQKIYKLAGSEFNISSPLQLREVLFDKLNIPTIGLKKGKTGLSTDAEQLEKMRGLHPVVDEIQEYRELAKLQNTYIDVLPTLINNQTGRIHTTFNQAVTATGRLSSSDPNLQNIPIRTALGREIRTAFVAPPGQLLLSADYSQIELRIVASLAKDKKLMQIFERGEDVHTATAAAIHGVPLKDVTKDMRRSAKEINFGILYGMGAYGLAWRAEIPQADAKAFITKYFHEFSGVKIYLEETLKFARDNGYVETLFGRRRYIPELTASNFQVRSSGERMAINHPIQGTAADLMKMAMIAVHDVIARSAATKQSPGLQSQAKMLLQVHDELVFEVEKKYINEVSQLVKNTMETVAKLNVPINVGIETASNWGELH